MNTPTLRDANGMFTPKTRKRAGFNFWLNRWGKLALTPDDPRDIEILRILWELDGHPIKQRDIAARISRTLDKKVAKRIVRERIKVMTVDCLIPILSGNKGFWLANDIEDIQRQVSKIQSQIAAHAVVMKSLNQAIRTQEGDLTPIQERLDGTARKSNAAIKRRMRHYRTQEEEIGVAMVS